MDSKTTFFSILKDLPKFTIPYTNMLAETKKLSTAIVQATEVRAFLSFIASENELWDTKTLDISILENVDTKLLDMYFERVSPNTRISKCSYLNNFFMFLVKQRKLSYNPLWDYEIPNYSKPASRTISYAAVKATLLGIASGLNLSEREATFVKKTQLRDMSIICLIYSGLSLSQCASLNVNDLPENMEHILYEADRLLKENNVKNPTGLLLGWLSASTNSSLFQYFQQTISLKIGENEVSISNITTATLLIYLLEISLPADGPLFYSLRQRRLSQRTIEHLVNKHFERYADIRVSTYALSCSGENKK